MNDFQHDLQKKKSVFITLLGSHKSITSLNSYHKNEWKKQSQQIYLEEG